MRWDRISLLIDKMMEDLERHRYNLHNFDSKCNSETIHLSVTFRPTLTTRPLWISRKALLEQIAWTIWIVQMSCKLHLRGGLWIGNWGSWGSCRLKVVSTTLRQLVKTLEKVCVIFRIAMLVTHLLHFSVGWSCRRHRQGIRRLWRAEVRFHPDEQEDS